MSRKRGAARNSDNLRVRPIIEISIRMGPPLFSWFRVEVYHLFIRVWTWKPLIRNRVGQISSLALGEWHRRPAVGPSQALISFRIPSAARFSAFLPRHCLQTFIMIINIVVVYIEYIINTIGMFRLFLKKSKFINHYHCATVYHSFQIIKYIQVFYLYCLSKHQCLLIIVTAYFNVYVSCQHITTGIYQCILFHHIWIYIVSYQYSPITYYWTVPLIQDHSYLVGKLTSSKIADTKVSGY